jgi:hypothetical protein
MFGLGMFLFFLGFSLTDTYLCPFFHLCYCYKIFLKVRFFYLGIFEIGNLCMAY